MRIKGIDDEVVYVGEEKVAFIIGDIPFNLPLVDLAALLVEILRIGKAVVLDNVEAPSVIAFMVLAM